MAVRLAFDLGLHIDMGKWVSKGKMTKAEENARRNTFWACWTNDQLVFWPVVLMILFF